MKLKKLTFIILIFILFNSIIILSVDSKTHVPNNTFSDQIKIISFNHNGDYKKISDNNDILINLENYQNMQINTIQNNKLIIKDGWPIETEFSIYSSPVIADLDGDNNQEIIIATGRDYHYFEYDPEYNVPMRKLLVLDANGNLKDGWPKNITSKYNRPPCVGDLDNDGDLEIIVFSRLEQDSYDDGFIYAWHHDGVNASGWPIQFSAWNDGVPPTIADLDNDHSPEIIVSELPLLDAIKLYSSTGVLLPNWPQPYIADYYGAVGNLDEDSDLEFVVRAGQIGDGVNCMITVLNKDGTLVDGWPKLIPELLPDGQLVIGDLDKDGIDEIIFSTMENKVYVLTYKGENFTNFPLVLDDIVVPSLVLADLNNNGEINIIGIEQYICDTSRVHAWDIQGNELSGFPVSIYLPPEYEYRWLSGEGAPIVLDIDGDGYQEIICAFQQWGMDRPNYLYAIDHDGTIKNDDVWPIFQGIGLWQQHSSLAAGDIDNDGMLEMISAYSKHNPDYPDVCYGGGEIILYDLNTQIAPLLMDWPQFQHDPHHSGRYNKTGDEDNIPPFVDITKPENALYVRNNKIRSFLFRNKPLIVGSIDVEVEVSDDQSGISKVEFFIDNELKETDINEPYKWIWDERTPLKFIYNVRVIAYDNSGNQACNEITVWKFF